VIPIGRWLDAHAKGQAAALRFDHRTISYHTLAAQAARFASLLGSLPDAGAGARVAYLGHNSPEQIALLFACARAGCALVPLNWRLTAGELAEVVADAAPSLLIVDGSCLDLLSAPMLAACGGRVYAVRAPGAPWPDLHTAVADLTPGEDCVDAAETPLLLVYTSGTTGKSKGSVLSQRAVAANARNSHLMHGLHARDIVLTTLPMFHVGGLNIQTLPALACGATVVLHARFDAALTLAAIAAERPTLSVQVPATMQALLAQPAWATTDLSSLRAVATGSTDVPVELIEAFHARRVPVIQVYGATETAPIAIFQRIADAYHSVGSIGRPGSDTDIRLVDPAGRDVGPGSSGEILIRGPQVSSGYWRDPAATATAFRDGWFHSGDIAARDDQGRYWFRDRIKNVIISGGENVYPAEIERIARRAPGIVDCAVVGRPDAQWGQVPVLFAVTADAGLDRAELQSVFVNGLARYKHPKLVIEIDALPRTALGKIDVGALRAAALDG
jgi:fatty-acyl-CoA synthase